MSEEEETKLGIKQWVTKSIIILCILMLVVFSIERYFEIPIVINTLIAIIIALAIGFTHEFLHYYEAIRLGYTPKWYRTKIMMGFEISHHSSRKKFMEDRRKIGLFPYVFLVPLSVVILVYGVYIEHLGIGIGGVAGLLLHVVGWPKEGKM